MAPTASSSRSWTFSPQTVTRTGMVRDAYHARGFAAATSGEARAEMARDDTLRVGVIGVGWAGLQHLAAYDALPGVATVAVAAVEAQARAEAAAQHGVEQQFDRWEDLLGVDGLDAVSVATPTFLHAPIAIAALERGLHVLCEKPIARTAAEA